MGWNDRPASPLADDWGYDVVKGRPTRVIYDVPSAQRRARYVSDWIKKNEPREAYWALWELVEALGGEPRQVMPPLQGSEDEWPRDPDAILAWARKLAGSCP